MAKTLTLMQGIPGSGKSTTAKAIANKNNSIIFSTDDFWYGRGNDPLTYDFDPALIGVAHRWNQQRTAKEMVQGGNIVIDNTNIKRKSVEPYLALAEIFEYEIQVVRVDVELAVALARNLKRSPDRQVPADVVARMHSEMETLL